MKIIKEHQKWEHHITDTYIYFDDNYNLIGSFDIQTMDNILQLQGLYIQPEFRCKGYADIMMNHVLEISDNRIIYLTYYKKKKGAVEFYRKYGFKLSSKCDKYLRWMKRKKNNNVNG